jgi:hypothetical protein
MHRELPQLIDPDGKSEFCVVCDFDKSLVDYPSHPTDYDVTVINIVFGTA